MTDIITMDADCKIIKVCGCVSQLLVTQYEFFEINLMPRTIFAPIIQPIGT